jgi:Ca2+-binding RTX toxin-like protein
VFEQQMEDLQDGDRFYYLSRTAGLNMLTQLEGNSFAELIMRNTDAQGLPADSFSFPAMVFDVDAIDNEPNTVQDDPATPEWNEATELSRMLPSGTIRYGGPEHVVFNGSAGNDRVWSSEGDDTIRGNDGNDWMEGGDGNDNLIGGLGDDLLTDLSGDDTLKGGDGDDTLSSGQGFAGDLNQGGRGNDFIIGGNDTTETFAGAGNDFVYAGDAEDTVFGDEGDDWIETGRGPFALAQGDNGAPFQDDPNEPGHDVLDGDGGEQDYDAEGGDDIMLAGPGIQRSEGMRGFDWVTHQGDPVPGDSDMTFTAADLPAVETNKDRFDLVEGLSGYGFDDVLRGDDREVGDLTGGALEPADSHVLDQAGIDRIDGLDTVLPAGTTRFDTGNIIIGGGGADLIEGRGGDDVIDGDAQLTVELNVPYKDGSTKVVKGLGALRADVLAGLIDPGGITIIRRIERPAAAGVIDTAVFSAPRAEYDVTENADGTTTVNHARGTQADGVDTLRNIEALEFADTGNAVAPGAPTGVTATAGNGQATVTFAAPASDGGSAIVEFEVDVRTGTTLVRTVEVTAPATSTTVTGLTNGTAYNFVVRAVNAVGVSPSSAPSAAVTPRAPTLAGAPTAVAATAGNAQATVTWTAPANTGGSAITSYQVQVRTGTTVARTVTGIAANATSTVVTGLTNGTAYNFRVRAVTAAGNGTLSTASNTVTPTAGTTATNPAPTVTGRTPAVNNTGVPLGANVTATFSEAVQGVTGTTFQLRNAAGTLITAPVPTRNGTTNQWILNPTNNLAADTLYTVTLTGGAAGIRDLAGAPLAATTAQPLTWSFTTGPVPTVTARTPAVNATGVSRTANVTATFSEPVQAATVTTTTVRLTNVATGAQITAVVSYNATTRVATLNPSVTLAANTQHRVNLTGGANGIKDVAGNPMVNLTWTFTTGAA